MEILNTSVKTKKLFSNLLGFMFFFSCLAIGLDSIKNPDTVSKFIFISSQTILIFFIIINFGMRMILNIKIPKLFNTINKYLLLPSAAGLCIILTLIDYFTSDNFVFNRIMLNYQQLGIFALGSLAISTINANDIWLKYHHKALIFLSALILLFALWIVSLWPMDVFLHIVREDNLIENSQFVALLISSFISIYIAFKTYSFNKLLFILYLIASLGLFFVAGDEISWGQRIFGIVSPEYIAKNNVQGEINIHNLSIFNNLVGYAYILVGLYGAFSWVVFALLAKKRFFKLLNWITPQWFLFVYFFFGFIYNFGVLFLHIYTLGEWSEVAELLLDLGVLIFVGSIGLKVTAHNT